ncbi:hypothetical protein JZ751_021447 [Albula glossodonta]|uniref:Phosphatidylinositol transfer protein N-terminal domain-containing protein n=1 Tax=Albula glossodonta TaxID=121402 RepID=A0A8T2MY06_9TELE|nr:hypothetical protein JZ751_021447 [Albula glossodonta]
MSSVGLVCGTLGRSVERWVSAAALGVFGDGVAERAVGCRSSVPPGVDSAHASLQSVAVSVSMQLIQTDRALQSDRTACLTPPPAPPDWASFPSTPHTAPRSWGDPAAGPPAGLAGSVLGGHGGEDYKAEEDPALFQSVKTGRGPLGPNWKVRRGGELCVRVRMRSSVALIRLRLLP